jgi:ABC-type uncharacterized transport system substrate-binding protein
VGRLESKEVQATAPALRLQVQAVDVPKVGDLEPALKTVVGQRTQALLVGDCPTSLPSKQLADLALQRRLSTMFPYAALVRAGGLMAYGPSQTEQYRRAATFVDKILKGAKPADLPVEQPTKFELTTNLKTAKAVLARAGEVIQ